MISLCLPVSGKWKKLRGNAQIICFIVFSSPSFGQVTDTLSQHRGAGFPQSVGLTRATFRGQVGRAFGGPDQLWEIRMKIWQQWASLSEKELFTDYHQSSDDWLRAHVPSIIPLRVEEGRIRLTSQYGYRMNPVCRQWKFHNGIDLSGIAAQPVYATAQGIVNKIGYDPYLGNYLLLSHAGQFETIYGHLSRILVKPGQLVKRGECIGRVGKSGRTTGYHLHYIVKRLGKTVDPDAYLFLRYGL